MKDTPLLAQVHYASSTAMYAQIVGPELVGGSSDEALARRTEIARGLVDNPRPGEVLLVAEQQSGAIVGLAHVAASRDEDASSCVGELVALYVDPAAQGRGIGSALLGAATRHLTNAGFTTATLWVLAENNEARRLYERSGWTEEGTSGSSDLFGRRLTELRYRRQLKNDP